MNVKRLGLSDCDGICKIENECFSRPWSAQSVSDCISNPKNVFLGVFENENLIGYGSFNTVVDEGYINNIAVLQRYRRMGIGGKTLDSMIEYALDDKLDFLTLEVRKSNDAAALLYQSRNFSAVGIRKNFYSSPVEDGIIMTLYFNGDNNI